MFSARNQKGKSWLAIKRSKTLVIAILFGTMMSQQQASQESSGQFEDDKEQSTSSSLWLLRSKGRKQGEPKSEHPSTFEESIPPLSYRAQDSGQASSTSSQNVGATSVPTDTASPDADAGAAETAQRPYSQFTGSWQVPSWARPQKNNNFWTIWFYVLAAVLALPALWFIITVVIPIVALVVLIILAMLAILLFIVVIVAAFWFIGRVNSIKKPPFWW